MFTPESPAPRAGGLLAARVGDLHTCPLSEGSTPHVGGPVLPPGEATVFIEGMPAARKGDLCTCVGPTDPIATASVTVFIGGKGAARISDQTAHGGKIIAAASRTYIGTGGPPQIKCLQTAAKTGSAIIL